MELPEYEHEWVVVSDGSGKTVTMRYLATVEYSGKNILFSATQKMKIHLSLPMKAACSLFAKN